MMVSEDRLMMPALVPAPAAGAPARDGAPKVPERTNLNPLAHFSPALVTGPDGKVSATVKLPDSVTRYRVWAVATARIRNSLIRRMRLSSPGNPVFASLERGPSVLGAGHLPDLVRELPGVRGARWGSPAVG